MFVTKLKYVIKNRTNQKLKKHENNKKNSSSKKVSKENSKKIKGGLGGALLQAEGTFAGFGVQWY